MRFTQRLVCSEDFSVLIPRTNSKLLRVVYTADQYKDARREPFGVVEVWFAKSNSHLWAYIDSVNNHSAQEKK